MPQTGREPQHCWQHKFTACKLQAAGCSTAQQATQQHWRRLELMVAKCHRVKLVTGLLLQPGQPLLVLAYGSQQPS
jgi:hypothetical protein